MKVQTFSTILAMFLAGFGVLPLPAQISVARPRIHKALDESRRVALKGHTHPLAQAHFDRGAAPADLPMEHMLLLLKRSPEQQAALDSLLDEQHDPSSPNYHQWLTPKSSAANSAPRKRMCRR